MQHGCFLWERKALVNNVEQLQVFIIFADSVEEAKKSFLDKEKSSANSIRQIAQEVFAEVGPLQLTDGMLELAHMFLYKESYVSGGIFEQDKHSKSTRLYRYCPERLMYILGYTDKSLLFLQKANKEKVTLEIPDDF